MIGLRLDKALSLIPEISSRSRAEYLLDQKRVLVNGEICKSSYKIETGDEFEISLPEVVPSGLNTLDMKLDILFEDKDVIVINKPAGLVVHPAAGHAHDTLVNALVGHTKDLSMKFGEDRPGIVHRLDRDTSGLLVVAKNDKAHEHLAQQFKIRSVHRSYLAVCIGVPARTSGVIESFLGRHPIDRKRYSSVLDRDKKIIRDRDAEPPTGKWAVTRFEVIKRLPSNITYLKLKLETGRTHQIRVHLSEIGLPIIGDETYGADKKIKNIHNTQFRDIAKSFPRFALHAAELGFEHPTTGEQLSFKVPWPEDLAPLLTKILGDI